MSANLRNLLSSPLSFRYSLYFAFNDSKSESTSNYSDETYWENRYKESQEPKKDVYEWYVSFENISATIEEDIGKLSSGSESLILVSGCGNSALCEDFVHNGMSTK